MSLGSPTNTRQHCVRRAQIRWPKRLETNDNSTQDQDRQPQQLSGDRPNQQQASGQSSPSERKQCGRSKCPPGHERCCGEDPGASAPAETSGKSSPGQQKQRGRLRAAQLAPTAGLCKEKPRAATGDGPAPFAEQRARPRHRAGEILSPTHGHFVGVSRKRPASAHHWLDLVRAQIPVGAMSVGEIAQITAAFVVVLAPLNWLVDNYSGLADCLSSANRVAKDQLRSARAPE